MRLGGHPLLSSPYPLRGCQEAVAHRLPGSDEMWSFLPTHPENRAVDYKITLSLSTYSLSRVVPTLTLSSAGPSLLGHHFGVGEGSLGTGTLAFPSHYVGNKQYTCPNRTSQIQAAALAWLGLSSDFHGPHASQTCLLPLKSPAPQ